MAWRGWKREAAPCGEGCPTVSVRAGERHRPPGLGFGGFAGQRPTPGAGGLGAPWGSCCGTRALGAHLWTRLHRPRSGPWEGSPTAPTDASEHGARSAGDGLATTLPPGPEAGLTNGGTCFVNHGAGLRGGSEDAEGTCNYVGHLRTRSNKAEATIPRNFTTFGRTCPVQMSVTLPDRGNVPPRPEKPAFLLRNRGQPRLA